MRYAIIDGIHVINVIDYDEQPSNPPLGFESNIIAVQSDVAGPGWTYVDEQFIAPEVPVPTPEELIEKCKLIATGLLISTDWATAPDISLPENNPRLLNKQEFITYRNTIRGYAVNPVANPVFPEKPTEQWSN